jgi:hypothetical protein
MLLRIEIATDDYARGRFRVEQAFHEEPRFKRLPLSLLGGKELSLDETSAGIAGGSGPVSLKGNRARRTKMQVD